MPGWQILQTKNKSIGHQLLIFVSIDKFDYPSLKWNTDLPVSYWVNRFSKQAGCGTDRNPTVIPLSVNQLPSAAWV